MKIDKALKIALIKRNLQQKDIADSLIISPAFVSNLANGHSASARMIERIAKALDYKVSEFIALGED